MWHCTLVSRKAIKTGRGPCLLKLPFHDVVRTLLEYRHDLQPLLAGIRDDDVPGHDRFHDTDLDTKATEQPAYVLDDAANLRSVVPVAPSQDCRLLEPTKIK